MTAPRFFDDRRGVSAVVGAVLILGMAVLAFASYQAFVVPTDNAEVEFNHNERVQDDMLELRNTIMTTLVTGDDGYATVELGAQFPQRLFAVNPANPTGTLETTELRPIVIELNEDDVTDEICGDDNVTRFIEYEPNYREFDDAGTLRYENSLLVHDLGETSIVESTQQFIRGDRVTIIPLRNEYHATGSETVSIEPRPGLIQRETVSDPVITIPTELDGETWNELLADELDDGETAEVSDGNLTVDLDGSYQIRCEIIGIDDHPESGERADEDRDINPVGEGTIQLINQGLDGDRAIIELRNRGATATIEEMRINFATAHEGGVSPDFADVYKDGAEDPSGRMFTGDDWVELDPEIEVEGDDFEDPITTFELEWNEVSDQTFFVLSALYDTGDMATYFVGFDAEDPLIQVDISDESDEELIAGETANVIVTVFNTGGAGSDEIQLLADDEVVDSEEVELATGEGEQIELSYVTDEDDIGELEIVVESEVDTDDHIIDVTEAPEDEAFFSVDVTETNEPVLAGDDDIEVTAEIRNVGGETGEQWIDFIVDGVVQTDLNESIELDSDEEQTIEFVWENPDESGTYDIVVASDDSEFEVDFEVAEDQAEGFDPVEGSIGLSRSDDHVNFDVEALFDLTVTDIDVETQNDMEDVSFDHVRTEIDGEEVEDGSVTIETDDGETEVEIGAFDEDIEDIDETFVDPESTDADIVITFTFDDGSEYEVGISAVPELD